MGGSHVNKQPAGCGCARALGSPRLSVFRDAAGRMVTELNQAVTTLVFRDAAGQVVATLHGRNGNWPGT
jgi:hypothetical protein